MDCLFCKIAAGVIPSNKVYEDDMCLAFHDINPQTPVHVLIIPKCHIASADEVDENNSQYVAHIFEMIPEVAKMVGLSCGYSARSHWEFRREIRIGDFRYKYRWSGIPSKRTRKT